MNVDFGSFQAVFQWVIAHGYVLMFLAMCAEGPTVTAAATFASTFGYFNPFIVFALSILGDVIPDMIYYGLGRWGRVPFVKRIGHRFGLTDARIVKMEETIKKHGGKTVAVLKLTPMLATPGLMMVGAMRMKFSKYLFYVVLVTLQKTLVFMAIGYFFGLSYNVGRYIKFGAIIPFFIILIYLGGMWAYKKYSAKIANKLGNKIEKI